MKAIHKKRLQKLIAFLRQLPRKRFDFAIIRKEPPKCGAVGCAIGYLPNVFPWVFKSVITSRETDMFGTHEVAFRENENLRFQEAAVWVTGIQDDWQAVGLFQAEGQHRVSEELPLLPEEATPKQVARMLEKFIKLQKAK